MKKFSVLAVTALLLLTFAACSGGGSDDYGLNDWTKALKEYNGKLENVERLKTENELLREANQPEGEDGTNDREDA